MVFWSKLFARKNFPKQTTNAILIPLWIDFYFGLEMSYEFVIVSWPQHLSTSRWMMKETYKAESLDSDLARLIRYNHPTIITSALCCLLLWLVDFRDIERKREKNIYLLFHLFMHSLVDSCMWGIKLTTLVLEWDDALTNWATWPGPAAFFLHMLRLGPVLSIFVPLMSLVNCIHMRLNIGKWKSQCPH